MNDYGKYPFVRILIPFALGILCYRMFPTCRFTLSEVLVIGVSLLALSVLSAFVVKRYLYNWIFGPIMAISLFFMGYSLVWDHEPETSKDYFRNSEENAHHYLARVYDCPTARDKSIRTVIELEYQFGDSLHSFPVSGKVMAYLPKTDTFALHYGDLILVKAPIGEVQGPKNPGEFDYQAYLSRKGITGQTFLRDKEWTNLQANSANPLYAFSYRFRDRLLASLQSSGLKDDEFGVAAAILLGYDDKLADEVRRNYVAAGSMHILCVSGLHVGIIYLFASFLLGFLDRKRWQTTLKQILLLALIWFYTLIAGLAPSILRASMMISVVIIGEMIQRKGFVLNSLAASALILLCINPNNLFEIGFQLSYAAVLGIVVLHRPIYNLLYVKNKLLDKVWSITALSLAAQLATVPFTLFHFNQFSSYFWLSNLLMTPLSFVVVISGMLLLMVSWIPLLSVWMGHWVLSVVYVMNEVVARIERLPFSFVKGLYVNDFEFAMLLLAFGLLLVTVGMRRRRALIGMLSAMLLFMVSVTLRTYALDEQKALVFYSFRKHTAVDFITGKEHVLLADGALLEDVSAVDYSLKGAWARRQLSTHPRVIGFDEDYKDTRLIKRKNLISFDGKLTALWDGQRLRDSLSYSLPVDYLLVFGKQKPDMFSVVCGYEVDTLLIDGSVPAYLAERWKACALDVGVPCINIGDGAVEITF